jgi:hypothetical protein
MQLAEERPTDEAPAEPLDCFCRKLAFVRVPCVVALFRDPSPLGPNSLFAGRSQTHAGCALQTAIWTTANSIGFCETLTVLDLANLTPLTPRRH